MLNFLSLNEMVCEDLATLVREAAGWAVFVGGEDYEEYRFALVLVEAQLAFGNFHLEQAEHAEDMVQQMVCVECLPLITSSLDALRSIVKNDAYREPLCACCAGMMPLDMRGVELVG